MGLKLSTEAIGAPNFDEFWEVILAQFIFSPCSEPPVLRGVRGLSGNEGMGDLVGMTSLDGVRDFSETDLSRLSPVDSSKLASNLALEFNSGDFGMVGGSVSGLGWIVLGLRPGRGTLRIGAACNGGSEIKYF